MLFVFANNPRNRHDSPGPQGVSEPGIRSVPEGRRTVAGGDGLSAGRELPGEGRISVPDGTVDRRRASRMGRVLARLHRIGSFRRSIWDARRSVSDVPVVDTTGYVPMSLRDDAAELRG